MNPQQKWIVIAIVLLIAGLVGGYFYGIDKGRTQGREALLAEQKAAEEQAKKAAQEELAKAANPFEAKINPFENGYQNPFENVNPFK